MDPSTLVALTVASGAVASLMGTVLAPIVLMWLTTRERRAEKLQDYARQDVVAAKAEETARLLLARQDMVAAKTEEAARLLVAGNTKVAAAAANAAETTNHKLDEIHIAVNSNLTKATQGELEAKEQALILMVEIMDLRSASGIAATYDVLDAIERAKKRISELRLALGPPLRNSK